MAASPFEAELAQVAAVEQRVGVGEQLDDGKRPE